MSTMDEPGLSASSGESMRDGNQPGTPSAWLIRPRRHGGRHDYNIEHGVAGRGWESVPDLRTLSGLRDVQNHLRSADTDSQGKTIDAWARQMWRLLSVQVDDLVVMPGKRNSGINLGTVTREYWFDSDDPDPDCRHVVSVDWKRIDVPRTTLKEDLQTRVVEQQNISLIHDNDGVWRLQQLMETGQDPGPRANPDGNSSDLTDAPAAWVIRAGRDGERYDHNIERGLAGVDFGTFLDLRTVSSRDKVKDALRSHYPDAGDRTISNRAGQLWRIRTDVRVGDLVVMPHKTEPHVALGTVTREYAYAGDDPDAEWPHVVSVNWRRPQLPWTAIQEDLRLSLNAQQSLFRIERHDGAWRFRQLLETGQDPGPRADIDLSALVEDFLAESGYPTDEHREQKRLREVWAKKLAQANIGSLSREDFAAIVNSSHGPARMAQYVIPSGKTKKWVSALSDAGFAQLLQRIQYLCWGEDPLWQRLDRVAHRDGDLRVPNFAFTDAFKTLAICNPTELLPLDANRGPAGRRRSLKKLGLAEPRGATDGQRVLDANDRLREHLSPFFSDDTLGMGAFLQWLTQKGGAEPEPDDGPMDLAELADELLVDVEFLDDIVELLKDKGQVILYGPPGTGKTYLARKLAEALAPDDSSRALVQFHPSTSYEDFFEGYRPAGTGSDGSIRFELTPGPLARIAERASESSERHVMIIDEINRGNLPRVLGELLFLLEYRDEEVETLYRTEEPFALPDNLWFIGTMNTADRSIALVDAALRRRFHFVPFFPDSGPMAGLLARWLKREDQPGWIGRLVDAVNDELTRELGGSHLLLGPSHFMKEYGSSADEQHQRLRRIWEYNIEPFIEDQFFGDPEQIDRFRFGSIVSRHRAIIERDRISFLADGEELDQGAEASGSSEAQNSLERSRARGATTPAWKDQFQGTPTAPTGDDELWKWRASNFPRRTEGRGEFQIYEIRSLACRWVEFALNAGVDPGKHDSQLVEDLLSPHGYSQSSLTAYRRHLREWFETDHDSAS